MPKLPKNPFGPDCDMPEAHEAHMQLNGECPWCGAVEEEAIREPSEWDFHDAQSLRDAIGEPDAK